ncbi:CTD kinase subunit gamma CTK3-domain-containing protein [Coniochaeta sp. 2T2.1]|nr:CTD kinase subunit gamma CTK3-domain-containing protein [Coniochaeta sp. 2T2.1]
MADPFEVRMRFTSQLQHLNASVTSAQKAALYALKYKDMDEDLHSCILEQLERNNMNVRANIMYFIEHFLDMANKNGHGRDYIRMMQRDIIRVVDAVAPDDGSGAANVKVVRRVLQSLQSKNYLEAQAVQEIEEVLKERDTAAHDDVGLSSPLGAGDDAGAMLLDNMPPSQTLPQPPGGGGTRRPGPGAGGMKLDRKQVEQRIEEDRERHKRLRESIWAVPAGPNAERDKLWEETSDLGEDDHIMGEEEWEERERTADNSCVHRREEKRAANGRRH